MTYNITDYSYEQAKKLNVTIKPSTNPMKKIDVFDENNIKIASIGSINYSDYPTYILDKGINYANNRRKLYHIRHKKDESINGQLAKLILW
jgi:hypothetical protein